MGIYHKKGPSFDDCLVHFWSTREFGPSFEWHYWLWGMLMVPSALGTYGLTLSVTLKFQMLGKGQPCQKNLSVTIKFATLGRSGFIGRRYRESFINKNADGSWLETWRLGSKPWAWPFIALMHSFRFQGLRLHRFLVSNVREIQPTLVELRYLHALIVPD